MQAPAFNDEYKRIEREEMPLFDAILAACKEAGLTQARAAERMGTKAPAIARLENALITGTPSPSLSTLRKYAAALGNLLRVCWVKTSLDIRLLTSKLY